VNQNNKAWSNSDSWNKGANTRVFTSILVIFTTILANKQHGNRHDFQ
jgi:hypothetical protein